MLIIYDKSMPLSTKHPNTFCTTGQFRSTATALFSSLLNSHLKRRSAVLATLSPTSLPTGPVREIVSDAAFLKDHEEVGKVLVSGKYDFVDDDNY